jgi:hypothetical protein
MGIADDMRALNLTGKRIGRLVVTEHSYTSTDGHRHWLCLCDCGTEVSVSTSHLNRKNKTTKSCGKCNRNEDLTGQTFNKLTPLEYLGHSKWRCGCECGGVSIVPSGSLKNGHIKSCGCIKEFSDREYAAF